MSFKYVTGYALESRFLSTDYTTTEDRLSRFLCKHDPLLPSHAHSRNNKRATQSVCVVISFQVQIPGSVSKLGGAKSKWKTNACLSLRL